jgi:hypothetical protein
MAQQRLKLPGHKQLNGKPYLQAQLPMKLLQLVEQESSRTAKRPVLMAGPEQSPHGWVTRSLAEALITPRHFFCRWLGYVL